ncbi:hypothetical protein [Nocardiopsis sp. LOL_012]|uniref:hypothetical protein n=1 Tax=Nocardiopsis sp. LOL_012 TaxID=3345409 RepID=UPI003A83DE60
MDPQNPPHIRPGQVWVSAHPLDDITVRVTGINAGRVEVVDAHTGTRPRHIWARVFHPTGTTRTGQPRRTGYIPKEQEQPR